MKNGSVQDYRWRSQLESDSFVNGLTGAADMIVDPTNPDKLVASMWEHERKPWFSIPGKGQDCTLPTMGVIHGKKSKRRMAFQRKIGRRIGLALQLKTQTIYALIGGERNGLYKSEDGGKNGSMFKIRT